MTTQSGNESARAGKGEKENGRTKNLEKERERKSEGGDGKTESGFYLYRPASTFASCRASRASFPSFLLTRMQRRTRRQKTIITDKRASKAPWRAAATETRRAFAPLSHARHLDTTRRICLFSGAPPRPESSDDASRVG